MEKKENHDENAIRQLYTDFIKEISTQKVLGQNTTEEKLQKIVLQATDKFYKKILIRKGFFACLSLFQIISYLSITS